MKDVEASNHREREDERSAKHHFLFETLVVIKPSCSSSVAHNNMNVNIEHGIWYI